MVFSKTGREGRSMPILMLVLGGVILVSVIFLASWDPEPPRHQIEKEIELPALQR